jgi:signal transduction histidine kinase
MQALDMEVYVPIRSQSVLVGVFALGHRVSGDPYTPTDFNVLMTVGDQTAVALQNARLVTDLKQANQAITKLNDELTRANRRLEKLDQAKTDFIQIASHELRTPLTQVRGYADILSDSVREGNPSLSQVVQISQGIGRATIRLEEIITAMLDVSQIDSEALAISRAPLTMISVIRFAIDNYHDALKNRKQTLTVEGIEELPPVQGDFQRLCQAFSNVVGNCIKYTPDGGKLSITGRIIDSRQAGDAGAFIEVIIADSGIGIDPEDQDLIFEKFYRVGSVDLHSTGQTKFKGAGPGLGLPIAKGVIQAHGGKIWVESEGQDETRFPGSRFHILLPAAPPSVIAEYNARSQPAVEPFTTAS